MEKKEEEFKPKVMAIKEIGKLPDTIEDMERNPILKPLLEYSRASEMFEKEDERESVFLKEKTGELNELMESDAYEDSSIAKIYREIFEIYQRLLWIYSKNLDLANQKMGEIKRIVKTYYVLKKDYIELEKELIKLKKSKGGKDGLSKM